MFPITSDPLEQLIYDFVDDGAPQVRTNILEHFRNGGAPCVTFRLMNSLDAVSYTHLTLPTTPYV